MIWIIFYNQFLKLLGESVSSVFKVGISPFTFIFIINCSSALIVRVLLLLYLDIFETQLSLQDVFHSISVHYVVFLIIFLSVLSNSTWLSLLLLELDRHLQCEEQQNPGNQEVHEWPNDPSLDLPAVHYDPRCT